MFFSEDTILLATIGNIGIIGSLIVLIYGFTRAQEGF